MGMGLFGLSEKLGAQSLDQLAALAMRAAGPGKPNKEAEHWSVGENQTWRWFERENLVEGKWKLTGITTPINKTSGERYSGKTGYLSDQLVPATLRQRGASSSSSAPSTPEVTTEADQGEPGQPSPARRSRHGRPPSKWLRSLNADELKVWLKTIDVPEAGVSGMTFWVHLTRDHSFDPDKIEGLNEEDQAKLHAAAHYGY